MNITYYFSRSAFFSIQRLEFRLLFVLLTLVTTCQVNGQEHEFSDSVLEKFFEVEIIRLQNQSGQLKIDFAEEHTEYQKIWQKIRAISPRSGSSGSRGPGRWFNSLNNEDFEVAASFGPDNRRAAMLSHLPDANEGLAILIQEKKGARNTITIAADPDHKSFRFKLLRPDDGLVFHFRQDEDGAINCLVIQRDKVIQKSGKDFDAFIKQNWQFFNQQVAPKFQASGINPPPHRYSEIIWQPLIVSLRPKDGTRQKAFQKIIDLMNSSKFGEREDATKQLAEEFDQWQDMVTEKLGRQDVPVELRSRLQTIIDKVGSSEQRKRMDMGPLDELLQDSAYLYWVAKQIADKPDQTEDLNRLIDQIKKNTDKDLGSQLADWRTHFESENVEQPTAPDFSKFTSQIDLVSSTGSLDEIREQVGILLPVKNEKGFLVHDTTVWQSHFGNRTTEALIEELEKFVSDSKLPGKWLDPGNPYLPETLGYPQILFESLESELEAPGAQRNYLRISKRSLNRTMIKKDLFAELKLHDPLPQNQRPIMIMNGQAMNRMVMVGNAVKPMEQEYFSFEILEKSKSRRRLIFRDVPMEQFSFELQFGGEDLLIRYLQTVDKDGKPSCTIQDIRSDGVFTLSAPTFDELKQKAPEYFKDQFYPLFSNAGIRFVN